MYFDYFPRKIYVQPHKWKALAETFWIIWLKIGLSLRITKIRTSPLFFKIDPCSATSMESSRRNHFNYMAEYSPTLKNNQNVYYHRFIFTPKTTPQNECFVFVVYLCVHIGHMTKVPVQKQKRKKTYFCWPNRVCVVPSRFLHCDFLR